METNQEIFIRYIWVKIVGNEWCFSGHHFPGKKRDQNKIRDMASWNAKAGDQSRYGLDGCRERKSLMHA